MEDDKNHNEICMGNSDIGLTASDSSLKSIAVKVMIGWVLLLLKWLFKCHTIAST